MRVITKIGDIFSVNINKKSKKYMQYIANDITQLNSDVIRAFKKTYTIDDNPSLEEIVKDEIHFYAHCVLKFGIKMDLWKKVGNNKDVVSLNNILFRGTKDYGHKIGTELIKVSDNWHVWKINDDKFTHIGNLIGNYKKAEIGIIVNPNDIVERITTGKYSFFYPDYR